MALFSGMLALFAWITIEKWMCWLPSIPYCTPTKQEGKGRPSFGGLCLAKGSLILDLSTRSLLVKGLFLSLGRV